MADLIAQGGPWGQQFPLPLFDGYFKVKQQRLIAEKHLKMTLLPQGSAVQNKVELDAIAFNVDLNRWPDASITTVHIAYHLDINLFRNKRQLQLLIQGMAPI